MADARKAVIKRMAELGWTQSRLAELCHARNGMSRATIHQWLTTERDIRADNLNVVLDLLGMDYSVIRKPPAHTKKR